jgi:hypothetical protein
MVESGTIETRRMASDPRFFEFKAKTERESTVVAGIKRTATGGEKKSVTKDEIIAMSKIDVHSLMEADFELDDGVTSGPSSNNLQDDLAKALGFKNKATNKDPAKPHKKLNQLEVMSQVLPTDNKDEIKKKMLTFRAHLLQEENNMQKLKVELKTLKKVKESMQASKMAGVLENASAKLNVVIKATNPKKEDQKDVLLLSYKEMVNSKALKTSLQKLIPKKKTQKKTKGKKDEEGKDGEESEEGKDPEDQE